ncbi:MAG: hypothetical protein WCI80_05515 [Bacteroidota bacterium]
MAFKWTPIVLSNAVTLALETPLERCAWMPLAKGATRFSQAHSLGPEGIVMDEIILLIFLIVKVVVICVGGD